MVKKIRYLYYYLLHFLNGSSKILRNNKQFENLFLDQKCYLFLTGSSIDDIDILKLQNENVFAVNLSAQHEFSNSLNINFYHIPLSSKKLNKVKTFKSDSLDVFNEFRHPLYYDRYLKLVNSNENHALNIYKLIDNVLNSNSIIFLNALNTKFVKRNKLFLHKKIIYYNLIEKEKYNDYTFDLSKTFKGSTNTMINTMLFLFYLGFNRIYLCGSGYTLSPKYEFHFYDSYCIPATIDFFEAESIAKAILAKYNKCYKSNLEYHSLKSENNYYRIIFTSNFDNKSCEYLEHINFNNFAHKNNKKIFNITPDGFKSIVYNCITFEESFLNK